MIVGRLVMLFVSSGLVLAALDATGAEIRASGQRLAVTSVVALLAPLFWPGCAATATRTVARIAGWSAAAACMGVLLLLIVGGSAQRFPSVLVSCTMLLLILLMAHALVAGLEGRLRRACDSGNPPREMAGRTVAIGLAVLGALPLWLGPTAELMSTRLAAIIDGVIAVSPLTHLAVASDNDLLRNQWFYQHANLAAMQFSYPGLAEIALAYGASVLILALAALGFRRGRQAGTQAKFPRSN